MMKTLITMSLTLMLGLSAQIASAAVMPKCEAKAAEAVKAALAPDAELPSNSCSDSLAAPGHRFIHFTRCSLVDGLGTAYVVAMDANCDQVLAVATEKGAQLLRSE